MCQHYPGVVLAFGPRLELENHRTSAQSLGDVEILELVSDVGASPDGGPFSGSALLKLHVEEGDELYAVTQLASRFRDLVVNRRVAVDLDHLLPLSGTARPHLVRLSGAAERWLQAVKNVGQSNGKIPVQVGVLDSGLDPECLRLRRPWTFAGYDTQGRFDVDARPEDPTLHGTRVAMVLDRALPGMTRFSCGRLPPAGPLNEIRMSAFVRSFADFVTRERPPVCNISIGPVPDSVECLRCHRPVETSWLASTILPAVFRLSDAGTFTVMAAGNSSRHANSRWRSEGLHRWLLAVATDEVGRRASYSVSLDGPDAEKWQAPAFGGTPESSFFEGMPAVWGTSFSAPLITALAAFVIANPEIGQLSQREEVTKRVQLLLPNLKLIPW